MARRYDSSTTTFSPEGRLHQVEYAIEAINNAGTCVGILATDGIVLASERRITSSLLAPAKTSEKTYRLSHHSTCCVAGLTADANILIDEARHYAAEYKYTYQEPIPMEQLVEHVCNYKQAYTQYGGLRPFGVAFLFAGYDEHYGFQLYQTDPSGNYSGWKATVIGSNNQAGKSLLKTDYDPEGNGTNLPSVEEALKLAVKVLNKTTDATLASAEKMELFTLKVDTGTNMGKTDDGSPLCIHRILTKEEAKAVVDSVEAEGSSAGDT